MLTLTPEAVETINAAVSAQEGAGLRIAARERDGDQVHLGVAVVAGPEPTDEVVDEGCQVFVAEEVAPLLDHRTLDGSISADEGDTFRLLSAPE